MQINFETATDLEKCDYLYSIWSSIPEEKWITGHYFDPLDQSKCCAMGHLVQRGDYLIISDYVRNLFSKHVGYLPATINDKRIVQFQQPTPRARILAALEVIRGQLS